MNIIRDFQLTKKKSFDHIPNFNFEKSNYCVIYHITHKLFIP